MIFVAPWQDALFGFVIVANSLIGTIQEYRSARVLAKLSVLNEARPIVVRDGVETEIGLRELVVDDLALLSSGDQIAVDGVVLRATGLEVDESLLTGEADPMAKAAGDELMSGSFVVSGSAAYTVTRVGAESFAGRLTEQARQFQRTSSELRDSINRFIRYISFALIPVGALLTYSQLLADQTLKEAVRGAIAGVVTMVPEGLVLLTSIAMAVGVLRLAQRQALVQEMPAVETLARVDIVCVDKTGTLTAPGMSVEEVVRLGNADPGPVLAALASAEEHPNPTMLAVGREYTGGPPVVQSIPFSSARKWSAGLIDDAWYVIGAPDVVDESVDTQKWSATGARVLLLARAQATVSAEEPLPDVQPQALIVIDQQLRSDAAETVDYFLEQGVALKVISGDNAETVGAIAARAGVPGADNPVDARRQDPVAAVEEASVFGRVNPDQKQDMVDALRTNGHTVAMTGDGVNDVLALKRADLGIAMGSGSSATRAVAQIVLMDSKWSQPAVSRGRGQTDPRQHRARVGRLPDQEHVRAAARTGRGTDRSPLPIPAAASDPHQRTDHRDPGFLPGADAQHRTLPAGLLQARDGLRGSLRSDRRCNGIRRLLRGPATARRGGGTRGRHYRAVHGHDHGPGRVRPTHEPDPRGHRGFDDRSVPARAVHPCAVATVRLEPLARQGRRGHGCHRRGRRGSGADHLAGREPLAGATHGLSRVSAT